MIKTMAVQTHMKFTLFSLILTAVVTLTTAAFNDHSSKMLLSDVKVLTLRSGLMTNARRSEAVPQLKCVGGSAQYKFTPKVVQCLNMGSDGSDIQWECKADMDNAYRFGHVEVTCEGYDYPNDPYILKGSCGLEYTLELTEEGERRFGSGGSGYTYSPSYSRKSEGGFGSFLFFVGIAITIFVIYKMFIADNAPHTAQGPGMGPSAPPPYETGPPPPYGFRPEFMPGTSSSYGYGGPTHSTSYPGTSYPGTGSTSQGGGGGFWSGMATGGLLGYMFGNRGNTGCNTGYRSGYGHSGFGSGWNSNPSMFSSSSAPSSSGSSGTRTSSGFGGTKRR